MKSVLGLVVLGVLAIALLGGCTVYSGYRQVINMDENVRNSWANVETELQRRYDLIPNLVATVKGVAQQEQKVFGDIANARKAYGTAGTPAAKAEAANQVESALSRLLVIVEQYPELRSSEAFLKLQDQLEGSENRIRVQRDRYNEAVRALNAFIRPFPGSFYASIAGVEKGEYFKMKEAAAEPPAVNFGDAKTAAVERRFRVRRFYRARRFVRYV